MNKHVTNILAHVFGRASCFLENEWEAINRSYIKLLLATIYGDSIKIGEYTYGYEFETFHINNDSQKITIGRYCSVAEGVKIFGGGEHGYETISTYPFKTLFLGQNVDARSKGQTIIGNDVWLGYHSVILSGVKIGDGAIIAGMSIVTKDVPSYAIVAGNPARIIKFRFSDGVIEKLQKIKWWELGEKNIKNNIDLFYKNLEDKNIDEIIKKINDVKKYEK